MPRPPSEPIETPEARARRRLRIAQADADIAYFQARLALIGEPRTLNQRAQLQTFRVLQKAIGQKLLNVKGKRR